ncbi:MAG: 5-deoxy-glucuronate isomerase [Acidobacteria bacterium]|nr:5-deoxy-glucuronate isomerase [Acidobacteriota bacterium]
MSLHIKSPPHDPGVYPIVRRGHELKYLSFTIVQLAESFREHSFETGEEEMSLDFYTGPVRVEVETAGGTFATDIPERASIQSPHPMVYVPRDSRVHLIALDGAARVTIGGALGKAGPAPALVGLDAIVTRTVGKNNFTRTVFTHIADNIDAAHLICGETLNRPGCWSSCPPHKHDRFREPHEVPPHEVPPHEVPMEEIYYFQLEPAQGFGFMRVYTNPDDEDPFDVAYPVEHGDTVLIPRGYHPVAGCPGYALNYTWILAGEGRTYGAWAEDPRHSWIKG